MYCRCERECHVRVLFHSFKCSGGVVLVTPSTVSYILIDGQVRDIQNRVSFKHGFVTDTIKVLGGSSCT